MNKRIKSFVAGALVGVTVAGTVGVFAYTDYIEAVYNNIKIVVDGKEIHPDSQPFISNGTTYLPVRAVSEALGKEVYWDGPNYTVYIGNMNGGLDYPSLKLVDATNIGAGWGKTTHLTDNYGSYHSNAVVCNGNYTGEYLLNGKYKRFRGVIYVPEGTSTDRKGGIVITADGKDIYTSPEISKTTHPVSFDVDVSGCNVLKIDRIGESFDLCIGDGGFYQ